MNDEVEPVPQPVRLGEGQADQIRTVVVLASPEHPRARGLLGERAEPAAPAPQLRHNLGPGGADPLAKLQAIDLAIRASCFNPRT